MPVKNPLSVSISLVTLVFFFVAGMIAVVGWVYADQKAQSGKIAKNQECLAVLNTSIKMLADRVEELNVNLKEMNNRQRKAKEDDELKGLIRDFLKVERKKRSDPPSDSPEKKKEKKADADGK